MRKRIVPFAVALLLATAGCSSSDPTMSAEYGTLEQELAQTKAQMAEVAAHADAVAAVKANEAAYMKAFYAHDLEAFMDTYTDDAVFIDETFGDHFEGKAAIRSMYANVIKFSDPDLSEVLDLYVSGDGTTATSTSDWIGTNGYGVPFHLPTALVHEYRDGKISRETVYYASRDAYNQLMGS